MSSVPKFDTKTLKTILFASTFYIPSTSPSKMWNNLIKAFSLALIVLLFQSEFVSGYPSPFGPSKKKSTTPKPVYKWRPKEDTRKELAKQKDIPVDKIPEKDPEFEFLWPDDYYDDYDFEHQRNMIQHGTWEAKRLKYHEAQLQAARDEAKKQKESALA